MRNSVLVRAILISIGCLCVVLGVVGLFVPMMPGVVFLLIAAWCFARSSDRFHDWLLNHRYLGPQIQAWHSGRGFERKLRRKILLIMWASMTLSMVLIGNAWAALGLVLCGSATTAYILKQPVYNETKG